MRVFSTVSELRTHLKMERQNGKSVGFVPTMGAFHAGHVALMRKAVQECDSVVVSVFVNPTQFAPTEDLAKYPRDLNRDSRMAQEAGVSALFAPTPEVMYPAGHQARVTVPDVAARWEGERRPTHFAGVATVCTMLFNIVGADRAYFGRKDYQQLRVIERMVEDLHIPVRIVPVETVRESDGLAMSSRNVYLDEEQRAAALCIRKGLLAAATLYEGGCRSAADLQAAAMATIEAEALAEPDYVGVVDPETLEPLETVGSGATVLSAARIGTTRLIDNMVLGSDRKRGAGGVW